MKPSETATRASAGQDRNQLMVHPFTNPGNFRARSGNLPKKKSKYFKTRSQGHSCVVRICFLLFVLYNMYVIKFKIPLLKH